MAKINSTAAASALLLGPEVPTLKKAPLWWLATRVVYGGPDAAYSRPVVFKRLGLSALAERNTPDLIDTALAGELSFRTPTLLKAYPAAVQGTLSLPRPGGGVRVSGLVEGVAAADGMPLVVSPAATRWPDQEREGFKPANINLPQMRIVEGRLRAGIPVDKKNPIAAYLRLNDKGVMLDGVRVQLTATLPKVLQVELSQEGIEFEAELPDPTADFGGGATIKAIVRLEITGTGLPALRLVGGDRKSIDVMEGRLAAALTALQVARTPASVRFDARPAVPAIRWLLEEIDGSLRVSGNLPQDQWTVLLDETMVDVRIASGDVEPRAVAAIGAETVMLSRAPARLTLRVNARREETHQVKVTFDLDEGRWTTTSEMKGTPVAVDLDLPAKHLQLLYAQSRATEPGEQPPFVFLPVRDGWLQAPIPDDEAVLPAPSKPAQTLPERVEEEPPRPTLSGQVLSRGPKHRPGRTLVVESAEHAEVQVVWQRAAPAGPMVPVQVKLRTWGTAGELRGYLFAAETSPTAEEGVPNLVAGEAATRDLALAFGAPRNRGRWWDARFDADAAGWTLSLQLPTAVRDRREWLAWMRDPQAGFVGIVPLTRAARNSARPSPSRDLLPLRLKLPEAGTVQLLLKEAATARVPLATYEGPVTFAESEDVFDAVMPTLPGMQFRPEIDPKIARGILNRWTWRARWRHGLPALDEFFGTIQVPKRTPADDGKSPQATQRPQPAVTALRPAEMQRSWLLGGDRISLSWVHDRFAFEPWLKVGQAAQTVDVVGWAQPYAWPTSASVSLSVPEGENGFTNAPPFGSYSIDGESYALANALPGIGQEGVAEHFSITDKKLDRKDAASTISVLGMAIASYADDGVQMDGRGFGLGGRVGYRLQVALREAKTVLTKTKTATFGLLTLIKPLQIRAAEVLRYGLVFYTRDLPIAVEGGKLAFDGATNRIESAPGTGGEAFEREAFGQSLHEWRLFESADGQPMRRYTIGWGPLSFVPLRLRKFEAEESDEGVSLTALWVLGRLELETSSGPWELKKGAAPFGPEEPYKPGELFMMKIDAQPLRLEPVRVSWVQSAPEEGERTFHRLQVDPQAMPRGLAYLRVDADQVITGGGTANAEEPLALLVGLIPAEKGAASLHGRLFGHDRVLDGTVEKFEPDLLELKFTPPGKSRGIARASAITVRIKKMNASDGARRWKATIELGIEFDIDSGQGPLLRRGADGSWKWMNLGKQAAGEGSLLISHESGAVSLHIAGQMEACEPLLGWHLNDLAVSGFLAHVFPAEDGWPASGPSSALFLEMQARSKDGFLLTHALSSGKHRIALDWAANCTSVIRWPRHLKVEHYTESKDWTKHSEYIRMVGIPAAPTASLPAHSVRMALRGQLIPVASLGAIGDEFGVIAPWAFLAPVQHRLELDGTALAWQTLDRIEILPAAQLKRDDNVYAFAPRYRSGRYRMVKNASDIPHPGVARPRMAKTGFDDMNLPGDFKSWKPVIRGNSVTAFIDDDDVADPRGFVAQVPWLADMAGALGGLVLAQCHATKALDWRFASVDAEHAAMKLALHRQRRALPLPADASAAEVAEAVHAALKVAADEVAKQRPVTQAWFELFDKAPNVRAPKALSGLTPSEIPFFPETMLVFDKLWDSLRAALPARTIFAKGDASGTAIHVRLRPRTVPARRAQPPERRIPVDIIALDRENVETFKGQHSVAPTSDDNLLGPDENGGRGRARLRELVKRKMPTPRVIFGRGEREPGGVAWQVIQMPRPDDNFGARLDPEPALPVPPSAALGWPSDLGTAIAGRLGPAGGSDAPIVSSRAGLAGRGSNFRLPAWAPGADGPEALYISFATHVAFQRPAEVIYSGPAGRHLSAIPARLRAPLGAARIEALRKLVGVENADDIAVAAICPPAIERTSIGDRAGELHAWSTSVVVPAEDFGFDPDDPGYGRPATSSPVLARQHRAPRSPLLTADADLGLRRRTYVSEADRSGGSLLEMKLFGGPATVMRFQDDDGEVRCSLEVYSANNENFRLGEGWDGQLRLLINALPFPPEPKAEKKGSVRGWVMALAKRLTAVGLLPASASSASTAQMRIGNERLRFQRWSYKRRRFQRGADECSSADWILCFEMEKGEALKVVAELAATNVDVPVAIDFQLAEPAREQPVRAGAREKELGKGLPSAVRAWPVRNLTIPLQRAAGARATLDVDLHTVAFGDAAYDRQLASPTFESPPTTLDDGSRLVIVVDREEYNLDGTVLLATGVRDAGRFIPPVGSAPYLSVSVQPKRRESDPKPPPQRPLRIPSGKQPPADGVELDATRAHALHPRSLVEVDGSPARLEPGDQLVLTVKSGRDAEKFCALMLRLTDLPSIAPPPSVYSLVTAPPCFTRACVAVHACGPLPDVLEYPTLEQDLHRGMVQRRALFIWPWSSVDERAAWAALVKVDRSGGAQLPREAEDFMAIPAGSVREEKCPQVIQGGIPAEG